MGRNGPGVDSRVYSAASTRKCSASVSSNAGDLPWLPRPGDDRRRARLRGDDEPHGFQV